MDHLNWELSVLTRAVAFSNLSAAASQIGVSQPQLSRIVVKVEESLGLVLLDRESKRRSSWTPAAYRLSEIYAQTNRQFRNEIQALNENAKISHVRIGTLEGLTRTALQFCHGLLRDPGIRIVELLIEDLNELEEIYLKHSLDLIFTAREPGRKKLKYVKKLGYQTLPRVGDRPSELQVMSSFEFGTQVQQSRPLAAKYFVSNSVEARRQWIAKFGGSGIIPSEITKTKTGKESEVPVLLIGSQDLPESFWLQVMKLKAD